MSRRRRAVLLLGLAVTLGGLAASDVARRESALRRELGELVPVVVARHALAPGTRLAAGDLAVRKVPARFAPTGAHPSPAGVIGRRLASPLPAGAYVVDAAFGGGENVDGGPPLRPGERVAEVVAAGSAETVAPGARVDVLVTREADREGPGQTVLALEDVEVLAARPAPEAQGAAVQAAARVAASLRVTLRQAVYLAAAQAFASELRLLPRAPGDDRRGAAGLAVDSALG